MLVCVAVKLTKQKRVMTRQRLCGKIQSGERM